MAMNAKKTKGSRDKTKEPKARLGKKMQ